MIGTNSRVLDLGSGERRRNTNYINMDIKLFHTIDLIGDIHRIPFKDNSFDAIIVDAVLEHTEDPHFAADEIWRVTTSGELCLCRNPISAALSWSPKGFSKVHITRN